MNNLKQLQQQVGEASRWFHPSLLLEEPVIHPYEACDIDALYHALKCVYPQAGAKYWSVRTWGLFHWQLIYLNVACVHHLNLALNINNIVQHRKQHSVYGYHFACTDPLKVIHQVPSDAMALVNFCGHQLRERLERAYEDTFQTYRLPHKKAFRLVAATLTTALVSFTEKLNQRHSHSAAVEWQPELLMEIADQWLMAMGLSGEASLALNGSQQHVVRRTCCLHYCVEADNFCSDCPKVMAKKSV